MENRNTKSRLLNDLFAIYAKSLKEKYNFGPKDIFAIGYMAGKYGLERLQNDGRKSRIKRRCFLTTS